jgi:hypothetical protein
MSVQVREKHDVIVAGGGTAGVIAAIAAARTGARTLLVEQNGFLGGTAVTGLPIIGIHNNREEQIVGGIAWELISRLIDIGEATEKRDIGTDPSWGRGGPNFTARKIAARPEALKFMALEMLLEAGVEVMLYTYVSDVVMAGDAIGGLVVENKSGRVVLPAQRVVDCTGDGDIAARAGAPFQKGRPKDGVMQPMTPLFMMSDVDLDQAEEDGVALPLHLEILGSELWRSRFRKCMVKLDRWQAELHELFPGFAGIERGFGIRNWGDGVFYAGNPLHITTLDASEGDQLSQAQIKATQLVWRLVQFLRAQVPGFENSYLIHTYNIGIRETRRIMGDYSLTYEDVLEAKRHNDDVVLCGYWVDIHDYDGEGLHTPDQGTQVKGGGAYGIPYRCLVPQKVEGVLIAGRCLSASHEAQASARVIAPSMGMGHAVGTAAALSIQEGVLPRELDTDLLIETLSRQGAIF